MVSKYTIGQYKDDRGLILWASQKLLKFDYKYLTIGTMKPGSLRGGHYHKEIDEKLMCITGSLRFKLDDDEIIILPGDIVDIPKGCVHTVYNDYHMDASFIEFKSQEFDQKKDDTYVK